MCHSMEHSDRAINAIDHCRCQVLVNTFTLCLHHEWALSICGRDARITVRRRTLLSRRYTRSSSILRDGLLVSGNLSVSEGTRYTYGNEQPQHFW